jgi:hypothetical protein
MSSSPDSSGSCALSSCESSDDNRVENTSRPRSFINTTRHRHQIDVTRPDRRLDSVTARDNEAPFVEQVFPRDSCSETSRGVGP